MRVGLLLDTVQYGHVLRPRFVSSGRRSDVTAVSSVGEPCAARAAVNSDAIA